jgi:acyl-CoA thioesterase-1
MTSVARRAGSFWSLAAVIAATSCGSTSMPSAPTSPTVDAASITRRIVVLGDSLALSPSRDDNFPAELQKRLDARQLRWTVTNASVSGDTTSGGLRRLNAALTSDTHILVLALGANDGLRGVDVSAIETNLSTIIERAQARGIRVLLCGMETPPTRGWSYTIEFHRAFPRIAAKYGILLVPFLLTGVALNPDFNGADDIHPNSAGARRIADTVWPYLEELAEQDWVPAAGVR